GYKGVTGTCPSVEIIHSGFRIGYPEFHPSQVPTTRGLQFRQFSNNNFGILYGDRKGGETTVPTIKNGYGIFPCRKVGKGGGNLQTTVGTVGDPDQVVEGTPGPLAPSNIEYFVDPIIVVVTGQGGQYLYIRGYWGREGEVDLGGRHTAPHIPYKHGIDAGRKIF